MSPSHHPAHSGHRPPPPAHARARPAGDPVPVGILPRRTARPSVGWWRRRRRDCPGAQSSARRSAGGAVSRSLARRSVGSGRWGGRVAVCAWWSERCCGTRPGACWRRGGSGRRAGSCRAARSSRARPSRAALVRELREELGVTVEVGERIGPDVPIDPDFLLRAWTAALIDGEPAALEHAELRWLAPDELDTVPWLPADRPIIASLATHRARG